MPYVLVIDEAFPLTNYLMRPFPERQALNEKKKKTIIASAMQGELLRIFLVFC